MSTRLPQLSARLRRRWNAAVETLQLAVWQRVIWTNRTARRARLWVKPIQRWLWLLPASYLIGVAGGVWLFAH